VVSVDPGGSPADSERVPTALRPRLTTSLPFAPGHWQIHHRPYIDRPPQTLIPEIRVTFRKNSVVWTLRPDNSAKSDESAGVDYGEAVVRGSLSEALVKGEEGPYLRLDREGGGEVDGVETAESGWLEGARLIE
jgi:hypothetical protein